jgi:uncharacterized protein YjiS (DUF1127 family)
LVVSTVQPGSPWWRTWAAFVAASIKRARLIDELNELSDRELADIGIARGDLNRPLQRRVELERRG